MIVKCLKTLLIKPHFKRVVLNLIIFQIIIFQRKIQYSNMVYIQKGQQLASIENQYQPCFKCRVKPQGANLPNIRGLGQGSRWFKLCILRMSPTHWAFPIIYILTYCALVVSWSNLNPPKPWGPLLRFWYCQKVLSKAVCMFHFTIFGPTRLLLNLNDFHH
jgi:hypothetical protein